MLSITAVSAGAVDYLLRGSGCSVGEGVPEVGEPSVAVEAPGERAGVEYLVGSSGEGSGAGHEADGVWFGAGLSMVGIGAGSRAREADVRAVFGQLRHPDSTSEDPVFLGRPARSFRSIEERIEAVCAAEPDALPERRAEIANAVRADRRKAVAYYDLTFSPVKSVSVYWAALLAAGEEELARQVVEAHTAAIGEAMAWAEKEVAWTRVGYHGRTAQGRSVGRYEPGTGLVWTRWDHATNRACEPQLHAHVAVLNRVVTGSDGVVRALDGRGFRAVKHGIDAVYAQSLEKQLVERCGVRFEVRPDGKAREILGIDHALLAEASSRHSDVVDHLQGLVAEYRTRHGHDPGPSARSKLARQAALATREAKSHRPVSAQLAEWCAPRRERLREAVAQAHAAAQIGPATGRDQRNQPDQVPDEVLEAAVQAVQARHATWDVGLLMAAISDQLPPGAGPGLVCADLPDLAQRVLAEPARFGIVQVSAPEPGLVPVPEQLLRRDGTSVLRPHRDQRYVRVDQLALENRIVALARAGGAPALTPAQLSTVEARCDSAGLASDQTAAVIGIVSSGRFGDVLIGPAGTGKSRTLGVLAQIWVGQTGGRVLGLATSQIATLELTANGLQACNTTAFRHRAATADPGSPEFPMRAGDLVVVDEVGMTSTADLAHITELVVRMGAKVVFTGDPEQLAAIEAGGMLGLLAADNGHYALDQVHRFTHPWEQAASLRLRTGDPTVLALYENHGRLRGGTVEEVTDDAVRAYLADTLSGRTSLLVTTTNDGAADLSARIRAELVRLGHVDAAVLGVGRDGNPIGVGDCVQARRNDHTVSLGTGPGAAAVTNRAVYRVIGHKPGGLEVSDESGRTGVLPHDYVAEDLTLGYAVTVWAAQGRTVDTCHALITPGSARRGVYVALTRGRQANTAYVVCERDGDEHTHEPLASTARAELASILTRTDDDTTQSAEQVRRAGIAEARSLAWIVGQWDLLASEACAQDTDRTLGALLPPAAARALRAEPGYRRLCRAVRAAEIAGHDPTALLAEVVGQRPLLGADSVADVLRWRIHTTTPNRTPERDPETGWAAMTCARSGPVGQYLSALATAAQTRRRDLGEHILATQPMWATHHLGAPPGAPGDRQEWARRAGTIAAYRELAGTPDSVVALGGAPSREQPLHRALWRQAVTAAGAPADALDYTTATEHELRQMRTSYQRQLVWAPPHVADELRDSRLATTTYRHDTVLWQAEADLLPLASPERACAERDVSAARHLADYFHARVEHLEAIAAARQTWYHDTEPDRLRAALAGDELLRRGLPRDPTPTPEAEQLTLLAPRTRVPARTGDLVPATHPTVELSSTVADTHTGGNQQQLFPLAATARDLAAAGPLSTPDHTLDPAPEFIVVGRDRRGPGRDSLGDARRHADILTALRAALPRWRETIEHIHTAAAAHHSDHRHEPELAYYTRRRAHPGVRELELVGEHTADDDLGAGY
jgi:conjugative relaxase-like TrwC/TraI family protein